MIAFKYRFHGHNSLDYVYKNGRTTRSHLANIKSIVNKKRKDSRIAVVVGKKIIKSAVKRNAIRRRVYEYVRPKIDKFSETYDIVIVIGTSELLAMTPKDMSAQFDQLFLQAGIIK